MATLRELINEDQRQTGALKDEGILVCPVDLRVVFAVKWYIEFELVIGLLVMSINFL